MIEAQQPQRHLSKAAKVYPDILRRDLNLASNEKVVKDPICGVPVNPEETKFKVERWGREYYFCSHYCMRRFLEEPRVAYFSMEIAVKSEIPT